jgi:AbrB family looped-hinge helix DNA binding protein
MKSQVLLATDRHRWETISMSDTHKVIVGDKGRIVIPASVREQFNWQPGDELRVVLTETGIELMTPDAILKSLVGALKSDASLTDQLIAERRAEAAREDAGNS